MITPMLNLQDEYQEDLTAPYHLVALKFHFQAVPELLEFFPEGTVVEDGFCTITLQTEALADNLIPLARLFVAVQQGAKLLSLSHVTKG